MQLQPHEYVPKADDIIMYDWQDRGQGKDLLRLSKSPLRRDKTIIKSLHKGAKVTCYGYYA